MELSGVEKVRVPERVGDGPRILFVPVSSPVGIGEYMRCQFVARACRQRWPGADLRFVVSREAPYSQEVPYPAYLTPTSPTKHQREVAAVIDHAQPQVVVFDASGRASQMEHAQRSGAATVFVSQHRRKRRRGFKWRRMKASSLHWIVQPTFVMGDLTAIECFKLKVLGRPKVSFIGPVFPSPEPPTENVPPQPFVFGCAGGGGNIIEGQNSAELFAQALGEVYKKTGLPGVMVMGPNHGGSLESLPGVTIHRKLPGEQLAWLLGNSQLALLGGGDLLGQGVSLGIPSVSCAVAKDQPPRIRAYESQGLCLAAKPGTIASKLVSLQGARADAIRQQIEALGLRNGLDIAMEQLADLL